MKNIMENNSIRTAIAEVASIVVAVLLALAVNEWNENRNHTKRANEAIVNVIQEIKSNLRLIKAVNKNNSDIIALIQTQTDNDAPQSQQRKFVPGLQIQNTAWKTLLSTGVSEHIEYSTLYSISSIYAMQDIYTSLSYQMIQTMMGNQALTQAIAPEQATQPNDLLYLDNMALIVEVEKSLLTNYQQTLEALQKSTID